MATQRAFDWQGRLESDGEVSFGQGRWLSAALTMGSLALALLCLVALVDDPAAWLVVGFLVWVAAAAYAGRAWVTRSGQLRVTRDGLGLGTRPTVPFARLVAVSTSRSNLTVHYLALPDERLVAQQRRSGQKSFFVSLGRWGSVRPDDLAVWLLKLKGGPMAEVDSRLRGAGMARVFHLRD